MDGYVGRGAELAKFSAEDFGRSVLYETDRFKVVLAAFEPGQSIPLHAPKVDLALAVLEGTGDVVVGETLHELRAGDVAIVPAGVTRGVRARSGRLVVLHVVSPPPTPADHGRQAAEWPALDEGHGRHVADVVREEHEVIGPRLDGLGELAREVEALPEPELRAQLDATLAFLEKGLMPHARAEEAFLYPAVDGVLRAVGGTTRSMAIDHRVIGEHAERLSRAARGDLGVAERREIERILVALEALLHLHFMKEEEDYLPALDHLGRNEAIGLLRALTANGHAH